MSSGSSIQFPLSGLILTAALGGCLIFLATRAVPNPHNVGRRAKAKDFIDLILSKLGVEMTIAIVVGFAAIFLIWMVLRLLHPHQADVIKVKETTN